MPLFPELSDNPWQARTALPQPGAEGSGLTAIEVCAGAGGQALGFEMAGVNHAALVELDRHACATLRLNRPDWRVREEDLRELDGRPFRGVDILAGGIPCPPFSVAGKQLGKKDERNLFPAMIRLADEIRPRMVVIENVRGFLEAVFQDYRIYVAGELRKLGYVTGWRLMNASDFGVPQLRPRVVFIAVETASASHFAWPAPENGLPPSVGRTLLDLMAAEGWRGAEAWARDADLIAPTVVGGSHKHGGPDLGPTRARRAWAALGVDGLGIANAAPAPDFEGMPRLTVRMVARLQGFPDAWAFAGGKTQSYRQVGNAFPPPFARAIARQVCACLNHRSQIAAF
ncbi:MAG TPA: DNA cytosine methyltransferase [Terriglobales bacterium]|jgi:DNA (cytosine-5)-methyltransferase 1